MSEYVKDVRADKRWK